MKVQGLHIQLYKITHIMSEFKNKLIDVLVHFSDGK